jgi:hypothetical protein
MPAVARWADRHVLAITVVVSAAYFVPGELIGASWSNGLPGVLIFVPVLLAFAIGARCELPASIIGLLATSLATSAGDLASSLVSMWVFTAPGWVIGRVMRSRVELRRQLEQRARELELECESFAEATAVNSLGPAAATASVADQLTPPAGQRSHLRLGLRTPCGGDDLLELAARGDQLVRQPGVHRAGAQQRFGERDQRRVAGVRAPAPGPRAGSAGRPGQRIASRIAWPRRLIVEGWMPRICSSAPRSSG